MIAKIKQFLGVFGPDDDLSDPLKSAHKLAAKRIQAIDAYSCLHCGKSINLSSNECLGLEVVSEDNTEDEDQGITKRLVYRCFGCGVFMRLELAPLIWNSDRDIYYIEEK